MPYATPTQYLAKFGRAEATQLLSDEEALLTEQLLLDAIAVSQSGGWTGLPSAAEQAAGLAALQRLENELDTASALMDGYLRAAVTLPVTAAEAISTLTSCCLVLTRCGLADDADNATERMREACDQWRAWLKDISTGRVQLVTPDGTTPAASGRTRVGQAKSGYDWSRFGGVR